MWNKVLYRQTFTWIRLRALCVREQASFFPPLGLSSTLASTVSSAEPSSDRREFGAEGRGIHGILLYDFAKFGRTAGKCRERLQ